MEIESHRYHEPCVTVSSIVKFHGMGGLKYALMVGSSMQAANDALMLIYGVSYDNDTNHQLMDNVLVGIRSRILRVRNAATPWFSSRTYRKMPLDEFPIQARRPSP